MHHSSCCYSLSGNFKGHANSRDYSQSFAAADAIAAVASTSETFYLLSYKVNIQSLISGTSTYDCSTVLINNGNEISGSTSSITVIDTNCNISNTVIIKLFIGDSISLLFWSNNSNTIIGSSSKIVGILPNGNTPTGTTATFICTRIN